MTPYVCGSCFHLALGHAQKEGKWHVHFRGGFSKVFQSGRFGKKAGALRVHQLTNGNKKDDFDPELDVVKLLLIIFVVTPIILNTSNRKEVLRIEEKIQLKPLICHGQKIFPLYQPNEKCWIPVETNVPQPSDIVGLLTCVWPAERDSPSNRHSRWTSFDQLWPVARWVFLWTSEYPWSASGLS